MARQHITIRCEATPAQRMHELMELEVEGPGSTLHRDTWLTRPGVEHRVCPRLPGCKLGEVESALCLLVERGLVEERYTEGELAHAGGRLRQSFRWSRWATPQVLGWRVKAVKPEVCRTCGAPLPLSSGRIETCSEACRRKAHNARGSQYRKARAMGAV